MESNMHPSFDLTGKVAVITGGCGLLGKRHARAIALSGGIPVLVDLPSAKPENIAKQIANELKKEVLGFECDITKIDEVETLFHKLILEFKHIDILINNAANNPKAELLNSSEFSRFEHFSIDQLNADFQVGITGAIIMSQVIGAYMADRKKGVIVNVASDLGVIAPDQRLYRQEGFAEKQQPVKPVSYSIVKTALIGLTRYLATYWAESGVRVNAISPGGVFNNQPDDFVKKLSQLIPMGRMANVDEYEGAIIFLCSDASSYMNGTNLIIDGGRSCW
ncbi:MAG: oxidoreductase [Verrucomicrobia bacterium RIFCSPHIGHO2_12_FULL_41_10]|nr:MAG: oxidoreductase [Verrucomicrobia bacterium RIFCSPHIGHO2_12_FULL_41_10]